MPSRTSEYTRIAPDFGSQLETYAGAVRRCRISIPNLIWLILVVFRFFYRFFLRFPYSSDRTVCAESCTNNFSSDFWTTSSCCHDSCCHLWLASLASWGFRYEGSIRRDCCYGAHIGSMAADGPYILTDVSKNRRQKILFSLPPSRLTSQANALECALYL